MPRFARQRMRSAIAIGVVAVLALATLGAIQVTDRLGMPTPLTPPQKRLSLTTGSLAGRRNEIATAYLAPAAQRYGLDIDIVPSIGSEDALNKVQAGAIDLALVGG